MKVTITSEGDFKSITKWLENATRQPPRKMADEIGRKGVDALKAATPKDTGETANSWKHSVKMDANGLEVAWTNTAHPESEVNVAVLKELGHGTRTGGYVPPQPFIKDSMNSVLNSAGDKLAEEMYK